MSKSIFTIKVVLLATLPVLLFSALSITLLIYKIDSLRSNATTSTGETLNTIYTNLLETKSSDIADKVRLKLDTLLDELNILRAAAQQLIDQQGTRDIDAEMRANPWLNGGFVHNNDGNWSNLRKGDANISLSVWSYLHDKAGSINKETQEYITLLYPIRTLMQAIGENGIDKGWYYLCGPKKTPVMIMTPWAQMPEIFETKYPGHDSKNWWDYFFPGIMEAWDDWAASPTFKTDNARGQITVTPLYEDAGGTGLMVTFFAPLWNSARTRNFGAAAVDYNVRHILDIINTEKIGENGFVFLLQSDGSALGVTDDIADKLKLTRDTNAAPGVAIAHYNLKGSGLADLARFAKNIGKSNDFETFRFDDGNGKGQFLSLKRMLRYNLWTGNGSEISKESLYIVAVIPDEEIFRAQLQLNANIHSISQETLYFLVAISALFAILSTCAAGWYALQNTRQIRKILLGISSIGQQNYNTSIDIVSKDDIGELARSFNRMIEEICLAYARLESHARDLEDKVRERTVNLEQANQELRRLSVVDGLTKVSNRRHLDKRLDEIWREYARLRHPISLIMIDIDHFKKYNDHYGHQAGDNCLRAVADVLRKHARRSSDVVARYGGEEFAVVVGDAFGPTCELAETLRLAVEALAIEHAASEKGIVSISLGVSSILPSIGGDPSILVKNADLALYESKNNGRDRVSVRLAEPEDAASSAKGMPT